MDKTTIMVAFSIFGEHFPVDEVTQLLNIAPTECYNKGDVITRENNEHVIRTKSVHHRKETAWVLSSGYEESYDVEEQLGQILERLKHKSAMINEIRTKYELECLFSIVIKMENGYTPGFRLNHEQIAFANRIQAEFDIDLYANPYSSDI